MSAIPLGTTVVSTSGTTVTISNNISNLGASSKVTGTSGTTKFTLQVLPTGLVIGASVGDTTTPSAIPSGRKVSAIQGNTVTINGSVTVKINDNIVFGFVGQADTIAFGFVGQGDT